MDKKKLEVMNLNSVLTGILNKPDSFNIKTKEKKDSLKSKRKKFHKNFLDSVPDNLKFLVTRNKIYSNTFVHQISTSS